MFRPKDGKRLWVAEDTPLKFGRQCRAASSIIPLDEHHVAVMRKSFDGWPLSFVVVNRTNGKVVRRIPARPQERGFLPAESNPQQLVAFRYHKGTQVLVKSLLSGRTWWCFPTGYLPDEPLMVRDMVFGGSENGILWALNLRGDQRVAWTYFNSAGWGSTAAERDGAIYIGDNDGAVYCFEAGSGELLWRATVAPGGMPQARRFFTTPAVTRDRLYIGAANGFLYALDRANGRLYWKYHSGDWIRSRPCVLGSTICVATLDGRLTALKDAGTRATPIWSVRVSPFFIVVSGSLRRTKHRSA